VYLDRVAIDRGGAAGNRVGTHPGGSDQDDYHSNDECEMWDHAS